MGINIMILLQRWVDSKYIDKNKWFFIENGFEVKQHT